MSRTTTNYLIIDSETATLPFINEMGLSPEDKKTIAIAKPLIYDIGWTIANRTNGIIIKRSFLVAETFSVPAIFNTAYYREKRPIYLDMIAKGETTVLPWDAIMEIFIADLEGCSYICAYNAMFDMKKAIPFTELYIRNLYSPYYQQWEQMQKEFCNKILNSSSKRPNPKFDKEDFSFRGRKYPMIDIWGFACTVLLNNNKFKRNCIENGRISSTGLYFSTSAETCFQYIISNYGFIEDHTALSDAEIETEILFKALKRSKIETGIKYFPFHILGETIEYIISARGVTEQMALTVKEKIEDYLPDDPDNMNRYEKGLFGKKLKLEEFIEDRW